jgi:hypothetical protein
LGNRNDSPGPKSAGPGGPKALPELNGRTGQQVPETRKVHQLHPVTGAQAKQQKPVNRLVTSTHGKSVRWKKEEF